MPKEFLVFTPLLLLVVAAVVADAAVVILHSLATTMSEYHRIVLY